MSSLYIPDKVAKFNAYSNGIKLGITGKVDTPEFKMKTSTMSGAGVGGEIDSPTPGQWESTEHEIPFALFDNDVAYLLQQGMNVNITYRGAMQVALRSGGYAICALWKAAWSKASRVVPWKQAARWKQA